MESGRDGSRRVSSKGQAVERMAADEARCPETAAPVETSKDIDAMNPLSRSFAPILVVAAMFVTFASSTANAQQPPPGDAPAQESGGGSTFHGYFATSALAGFALFLVARTARR